MSSSSAEPSAVRGPEWHAEMETPIVDGKYVHPVTGEICVEERHIRKYLGPPAVEVIIMSLARRQFYRTETYDPPELLLWHIAGVIRQENLEWMSIFGTKYSIRITLGRKRMSKEQFDAICTRMLDTSASTELPDSVMDTIETPSKKDSPPVEIGVVHLALNLYAESKRFLSASAYLYQIMKVAKDENAILDSFMVTAQAIRLVIRESGEPESESLREQERDFRRAIDRMYNTLQDLGEVEIRR